MKESTKKEIKRKLKIAGKAAAAGVVVGAIRAGLGFIRVTK